MVEDDVRRLVLFSVRIGTCKLLSVLILEFTGTRIPLSTKMCVHMCNWVTSTAATKARAEDDWYA